jgi:transposase
MTENTEVFVGIDISKDQLDVHVRPMGTALSFDNNEVGCQALVEAMKAYPSALIIMEATGGLERLSACALSAAEMPVLSLSKHQLLWSILAKCVILLRRLGDWLRRIIWMRRY